METDKYIGIKSFSQLQEARKELNGRIVEKAKEIDEKYAAAKDFYSPANIVATAIRNSTESVNWIPFALTAIRCLKRRLQ